MRLMQSLALVGLVGLAACAAPTFEQAAGLGVIPTKQYPLKTETAPTGILLAPHDYGLSQAQGEALEALAVRWKENSEGRVLIESPAGGGPDAGSTAYAARDALERMGVPSAAIEVTSYQAGSPGAPIRVSHLARVAMINDCGRTWTDVTKSGSNQPNVNFGCAVNSNLAAMIDNPNDIDRARGVDPVDAGRRQNVIDAYRRGETTSSQQDDQANGAVSRAVN
jgi:pilus assembly protein CpaD